MAKIETRFVFDGQKPKKNNQKIQLNWKPTIFTQQTYIIRSVFLEVLVELQRNAELKKKQM